MSRASFFHLCLAAGLLAAAFAANCGTDAPEPASERARETPSTPAAQPADWLTTGEPLAAEPTAVLDASGREWIAYLEFQSEGDQPRVALVAGVRAADGQLEVGFRSPPTLDALAEPTLVRLGDGVFLACEGLSQTERGLYGWTLARTAAGFEVGALERLATGRVLFPSLAETRAGELEVVFQALAGEHYEIRHARRAPAGAWSEPTRLFDAPGDYWRPRAASRGDGQLHVVCDSFDGDRFVVDYARLSADEAPTVLRVADSAGYQGMPSLALDARGRAWIAWEQAAQFGEIGGLRSNRELRLAAVDGGKLFDVPAGTLEDGLPQRSDFPRVACGPRGLSITSRAPGESFVPKYAQEYAEFYTSWFTHVLRFEADGRAHGSVLDATDGDGEATEVLLSPAGGESLVCVFAADLRTRQQPKPAAFEAPIETNWRIGVLELPAPTGFPELVERARATPPYVPKRSPARDESGEARPYFGDLHRHTQLSRCQGTLDGTGLDAYRYARGPGRLDFLSITDHYQHLTPFSHWRALRDVERFHAPGSLVTFPGVERALRERAHVNEIYELPAEVPDALEAFHREPDVEGPVPIEHTVAIPHMMGMKSAPFPWKYFRSDLNRVMEVYQGLRGSYEGPGLPYEAMNREVDSSSIAEGQKRGLHFGLIAASDHRASSSAYAGVWADVLTRESIFGALRARRTFGATAEGSADLALGALRMGDEGPAARGAELVVSVKSDQPLATIEVIKNGELFERLAGDGPVELVAISCRRYQALGRETPDVLDVRVRGGKLLSATERTSGRTGAELKLAGENRVTLSKDIPWIDFVLAIERDPSAPAGPVLELRLGDLFDSVPLGDLPVGRSIKHPAKLVRESIWRIGAPLEQAASPKLTKTYAIADPERAAGDSYYARLAFANGDVIWTSPIRVTELED